MDFWPDRIHTWKSYTDLVTAQGPQGGSRFQVLSVGTSVRASLLLVLPSHAVGGEATEDISGVLWAL